MSFILVIVKRLKFKFLTSEHFKYIYAKTGFVPFSVGDLIITFSLIISFKHNIKRNAPNVHN